MTEAIVNSGASHMRVCMNVLNPSRTDERVMREATALVEAGYDVTIVDVEHDSSRPSDEMFRGVRLRHALLPQRFNRYYKPTNGTAWMAFKLLRIFYAIWLVTCTAADVYHAHDITALLPCYLAAIVRRKKLVFDAHELPLVQPHIVKRRVTHGLAVWLLRLLMHRCDAAITVSPPLVDVMRGLYGGPRAWVIRNAPLYQALDRSDKLRERLGLASDTRIALYQGGIQENRSLDILVRAAQYLDPRIVIVIMGDGPLAAPLAEMITNDGVGDRVKMLPAVRYQELLSWTASADLGLLLFNPNYSLSIKHSLPNKLFEYLMAGLPILTTEMDAIVDIVRQYDVGSVAPAWEPKVIGDAISTELADSERRAIMRGNALRAAQYALCWEVEKIQLEEFYRRLLTKLPVSLVSRMSDMPPEKIQPSTSDVFIEK